MVAAGGRAGCARWAAWCFFDVLDVFPARRVFFCVPTYVTKTPKKQVWQHSYTRVRRPLIIARLTQRTPCPGIWSECRSYALLLEGSLPEVTGSSPIKFGDLPVLSTVIRPFFFVFWLCGRRGGKIRGGEHPEHQEPGTNTTRRAAPISPAGGRGQSVWCQRDRDLRKNSMNKLPLLAAAQTHHPPQ